MTTQSKASAAARRRERDKIVAHLEREATWDTQRAQFVQTQAERNTAMVSYYLTSCHRLRELAGQIKQGEHLKPSPRLGVANE